MSSDEIMKAVEVIDFVVAILPWTVSSQAIEFLSSYFMVLGGRLRNDDGYTRTGTLFYDKGFFEMVQS